MSHRGSLSASLVASTALHAVALGVLVATIGPPALRPAVIIPVSLVGLPGGGSGGGEPVPAPATPAPAVAPVTPAPPEPIARPTRPRPAARPHPSPAAAPQAAAPSAEPAAAGEPGGTGTALASGTGGDGPGGRGDGVGGAAGGGEGAGEAHAVYGPRPLYPQVAVRLRKEGVVLLDVLVAPDGHAADVRVLRSCGFPPLDQSAVTTVRERWRFVPARQGTAAVESRGWVEIRFRLSKPDGDDTG